MATFKDDRTDAQRQTQTILIAATDRFMSGWGLAPGKSYVAWDCKPEHADRVLAWVKSRSDMTRVRVVGQDWRPRMQAGDHCQIHVVTEAHRALDQERG